MKKLIMVTICGILSIMIITFTINSCNKKLFGDIDDELETTKMETTSEYDLDFSINEYDFKTQDERKKYVTYINENFVGKEFNRFTDIDKIVELISKSLYKDNNKKFVINNLIFSSYKNLLLYMLQPNNDWTDLPITENFRKKFNEKDGILKYYNLPREIFYDIEESNIKYGNIFKLKFNEKYIEEINTKIYGKDYDNQTVAVVEKGDYEFCIVFDDKDYIDNVYYLGKNIEEYLPPDYVQLELELDDIDYIRDCVYELCVSEEYLMKGSYELTDFDTHISNMNVYSINYKYREKVFKSNGILPIKDYQKDSLEVISYDENNKEAIVKIETEDKKIYYKIKLNIDEYYTLEDADVSLYKEEKK